jgi:hypothetical protein
VPSATKVVAVLNLGGTAEAVPSRLFYCKLLTVSVTNEHND